MAEVKTERNTERNTEINIEIKAAIEIETITDIKQKYKN